MMLSGFLLLLLLTGGSNGQRPGSLEEDILGPDSDAPTDNCREDDIIDYLNLTNTRKFAMSRPANAHTETTEVSIRPDLRAILEVKEKEQKLITNIWITYEWGNKFISWKPEDFCTMDYITVPGNLLWKPDINIAEMTEKKDALSSKFLTVTKHGLVISYIGMVLVSTCRMRFHKFPLDTHSCTLTFMSLAYDASDVDFKSILPPKEDIYKGMQTEAEWQLIDIKEEKTTQLYQYGNRSRLIYTLTIRRRSILYVVNFILPILFFLCLDLASFLISETGGEKLSFKVTVLLAVTVMQLILNDILPSSSDKIPLIAIYCIGVFGLMMMSLLETILVMYLMEKDVSSQDREAHNKQSLSDDHRDKQGRFLNCLKVMNQLVRGSCILNVPPGEIPSTTHQEGSSSKLTSGSEEKLEDQLRDLVNLPCSNMKDAVNPGYWARKKKIINKIFFVFYITSSIVFLGVVFSFWFDEGFR